MRRTGNRWVHSLAIVVAALALSQAACERGGRRGASGSAASGAGTSEPSQAFLQDEAQTAQLAIQALDIYRRDRSDYPADATELTSVVPEAGGSGGDLAGGWAYSRSGSGYNLRRGLRGGHALVYEYDGSSGSWEFQPASGPSRRMSF